MLTKRVLLLLSLAIGTIPSWAAAQDNPAALQTALEAENGGFTMANEQPKFGEAVGPDQLPVANLRHGVAVDSLSMATRGARQERR